MYRVITTFCFLSAFFPAVLWALGGTSTESPARVDPSVVEGADKYLKAVLAGDTSAIAAMFRDDAALMPAECPLLRGRAAIEGTIANGLRAPPKLPRSRSLTWNPRFLARRHMTSVPTDKPCHWVRAAP
jgi:hypothetical protein